MMPIKHSPLGYWVVTLLGFIASTAFAEHKDPADSNFKIPRAELIAAVKTIGILPITVDPEVPDAEAVAARYETQIATRFQGAGFSVVPAAVMREIRGRINTTLGGIYDPMTGNPIKEKVNSCDKLSNDEYLASHKVDALLESAIVLRSADFSSDQAEWDGVTDSSSGRSGAANFMMSMTGVRVSGQVPVLSFVVRLSDPAGKLLYTGAGGLQVLGYSRVGVRKLLSVVQTQDVSAKFIVTDPARDARALSLALDPLLQGTTPSPIKIASVPADAAGAAGAQLSVSRDELIGRFPRLALAPLAFQGMGERDQVQLRYRQALTQGLTQFGFEVVGGDDYRHLWDAEQLAARGFFDPFTGKLDKTKVEASRVRVFQSMHEHQAVTAVVLPEVIDRVAMFAGGIAEWDGVKESLTPGKSRLSGLFDRSMNYGGRMSATSLEVNIIEPGGEVIFKGIGGIELTERFSGGEERPLTESELFSDPGKDKRAVDIALATLAAPAFRR